MKKLFKLLVIGLVCATMVCAMAFVGCGSGDNSVKADKNVGTDEVTKLFQHNYLSADEFAEMMSENQHLIYNYNEPIALSRNEDAMNALKQNESIKLLFQEEQMSNGLAQKLYELVPNSLEVDNYLEYLSVEEIIELYSMFNSKSSWYTGILVKEHNSSNTIERKIPLVLLRTTILNDTKIEDGIRNKFKDPSSVSLIGNPKYYACKDDIDKEEYCVKSLKILLAVEVRAKNGFGGYGTQHYYVSCIYGIAYFEIVGEVEMVSTIWGPSYPDSVYVNGKTFVQLSDL